MGFRTRVVDSRLLVNYEAVCSSNSDDLYREYRFLTSEVTGPIDKWLSSLASRGKTKDVDPLLLELLCALYKKLSRIEGLLANKTSGLLALKSSCFTKSLGHSLLVLDSPLDSGVRYYGRIAMPVFPERDIPFFGVASGSDTIVIEEMGSADTQDFDFYIADQEREFLRRRHSDD